MSISLKSKTRRQVVAMGGGGFLMEPGNLRLDRYVLSLVRRRRARVCFVGTASGDSSSFNERFYAAFGKMDCVASDLPLFKRDGRDVEKFLLEQDVIYVGGGNTANLLAVWRVHGVDKAMRRAYEKGVVLCGISAGMICWFEGSVTDSFGELRELDDGLGLLRGSACPHFDGEARRRPTYHRLIREGKLAGGVAADDGAAIHYVEGKIFRCVGSREGARAYRVRMRGGEVVEEVMATVMLGRSGRIGVEGRIKK